MRIFVYGKLAAACFYLSAPCLEIGCGLRVRFVAVSGRAQTTVISLERATPTRRGLPPGAPLSDEGVS